MNNRLIDKVKNIREAHFYRQGNEISPAEIFDDFYSPLAHLIEHNRKMVLDKRNSFFRSSYSGERTAEVLEKNARDELESKNYGFMAKVILHTGEAINFAVKPRTNFHASLVKTPNIAYLYSDKSSPMILREAVNRDQDEVLEKNARSYFGKKYVGKLDLVDRANLGKSDVAFVPEPNLVLGLEQIYFGQVAPRITPSFKIVDFTKKDMWYIRDFLPSFRDSSCPNSELFDYNGVLNGLGLMDSMDNQFAHYCVEGNRVVNVDPDFIAYTKNPNVFNQVDLGQFKQVLREENINNDLIHEQLNKQRHASLIRTSNNLGGNSFLDYLRSDISSFPMFDSLRTENSKKNSFEVYQPAI